jgi:hypothetical protein
MGNNEHWEKWINHVSLGLPHFQELNTGHILVSIFLSTTWAYILSQLLFLHINNIMAKKHADWFELQPHYRCLLSTFSLTLFMALNICDTGGIRGRDKDVEGSQSGLFKVPSQHSPGVTEEKPWENLSQDGRFRAGFELTNPNSKPLESTQ